MKKIVEMINNTPIQVKASVAFLFVSFIQKGIAFITTPVFTRILSTDDFGVVSVYYSVYALIGTIAMFCLSYGVFNNGMLEYKNDRNSFSFSLLLLSNIITIVTFVLWYIFKSPLHSFFNIDDQYIYLMFLTFIFLPAYKFWTAKQRYEYKYKATSIITVSIYLISSLTAIFCVVFYNGNKAMARIVGGEGILIIGYICFYIYIIFNGKPRIKLQYWKYALAFNAALIPHYLSVYVLDSSDRIMISTLIGDSEAGIYSLAASIAAVLTTIWSAINATLLPYTYEKLSIGDCKSISRISTTILLLFGAICSCIMLFAPELVMFMGTGDYENAISIIPLLVAGVFFQSTYFLFANVVYFYKKPKYVMFASVSSACLNVLLNYLFIPKYGFEAAAYTTMISFFIQSLIDYFAMSKITNDKIYDIRTLLVVSVLMFIMGVLIPVIYGTVLLRLVVFGVALLVVVFKYNNLKSYLVNLIKRN